MAKRVILRIDVETGELFIPGNPDNHKGVQGKGNVTEEVVDDKEGEEKGCWYWTKNSPGCVYIKHGGVWKKICS